MKSINGVEGEIIVMLKDLVVKNRSYRGFDESVKVSEETLKELVELTRYVASGANLQPLKYRLVYKPEEVAALNKITNWAKMLSAVVLPHEGQYPAAYIAVCVDTAIVSNTDGVGPEIGIAAQTILLGAVEKGLGGCMLGNFDKVDAINKLRLPEDMIPKLLIAIGKPVETVKIVDVDDEARTAYYRDREDVHYVPKRKLNDIII